MNTLQLRRILSRDKFVKESFLDVYSSDNLPVEITKHPACFVANLDSSSGPGTHWVVFYLPAPGQLEFFDSYGNTPAYYVGPISNFQSKFNYMNYNPLRLQSNSTAVCGQYCVYYLYFRCRGKTLMNILSSFVTKNICNDKLVYHFVWKHFKIRTKFYQ